MEPVVATQFTPVVSFVGGALIGLSAVLLMILLGRIAGIAGISVGALSIIAPLQAAASDWAWRIAFVVGLVTAPIVIALIDGRMPLQTVSTNLGGMVLAGVLVGAGTTIGSGCTSGHGVCGLARMSTRSLVSVSVFMAAAVATVFVLRHVF